MAIEVKKLGEPLLAEVIGLDLSQPIEPAIWAEVDRAFLEHCVLVFREQMLSAAELVRFIGNFGPIEPHITRKYNHPEFPELIVMTNLNAQGEVDPFESERGVGWHTDMCYRPLPSKATVLHTLEIPEVGGDTLFANMYLALEEMPTTLRRRIEGREGLFLYGGRVTERRARLEAKEREAPPVVHPIVKQHRESGRDALFVNPTHTIGISGMPDDEAEELLEKVYAWAGQPRYQARHRWRLGDTLIWDNRCTWHGATGENPLRQRRRFLRGTIADRPR